MAGSGGVEPISEALRPPVQKIIADGPSRLLKLDFGTFPKVLEPRGWFLWKRRPLIMAGGSEQICSRTFRKKVIGRRAVPRGFLPLF